MNTTIRKEIFDKAITNNVLFYVSIANKLQKMYDDANFYGYSNRKGKRYYESQILSIAKRVGIKLEYNCPA